MHDARLTTHGGENGTGQTINGTRRTTHDTGKKTVHGERLRTQGEEIFRMKIARFQAVLLICLILI